MRLFFSVVGGKDGRENGAVEVGTKVVGSLVVGATDEGFVVVLTVNFRCAYITFEASNFDPDSTDREVNSA
eukprot:gene35435-45920_t